MKRTLTLMFLLATTAAAYAKPVPPPRPHNSVQHDHAATPRNTAPHR